MGFDSVTNAILVDELEVIDAIYGPGTVTLISTRPSHVSIELRLPGNNHAFLVSFPAWYPAEAPAVTGVDSLQLSLRPDILESLTFLRISVVLAYTPGQVILFDVIEKYGEIGQMRQRLGKRQVAERQYEDVVEFGEWMKALTKCVCASLNHSENTGRIPADQIAMLTHQIVGCAVYLDPFLKQYGATLSCKHSFCVECLQEGLGSMMEGNGEFKCCGNFVPTPLVQQFGNLASDRLVDYQDWLIEASSAKPIYCCQKTCSAFIPSYLFRNGLARCMKCQTVTCVSCRGKQHVGVCGSELKKIKNIARLNRWKFCPACSHLVERTFGCNHMTCVCGTRFCYHCGRQQNECFC